MRLVRAALGELSDLELAYFATYAAANLSEVTRRKIGMYLDERKLNKTKIKALIELHESQKSASEGRCCPRCNSTHLQTASENPQDTTVWLTYKQIERLGHHTLRTYWAVAPSICRICQSPLNTGKTPKPRVNGIRVFTSSLRS